MQNPKIVSNGPIDPVAVDILQPFGEIIIAPGDEHSTLLPLLADAIGMIVRGELKVTREVLAAAGNLKVLGRSGVGYNNVDVGAATARGIPVVFTPGAASQSMAEGAMTMMLALAKRLVYWDTQVREGNWDSRFDANHRDIYGATLGIIGLGRIGRTLARLAQAFEMKVLAHDPLLSAADVESLGVELVSLEDLLARADFTVVHAALTDDTRGMINRETLALVKRGAYFINLARGGVVESLDAVYEALQDGRLAGAGLDVFEPEPPDLSHPIFKLPNCLTTPHVLGISRDAIERIFRSMANDMAAVLRGDRPRHVVNPEVLD